MAKSGSKYRGLFNYLESCGQDGLTLSFSEIEAAIAAGLPPSARVRRDWWGNRAGALPGALQSAAWINAGYEVTEIDLVGERVTFARPIHSYQVRREGDMVLWDGGLIKMLRAHMRLNQSEFAEKLGVRQQTVSEWETGTYMPSRATCKYLMLVAERANFTYGEEN